MVWRFMEIDGTTYGRGQCGARLQCWPQFEQAYKQISHWEGVYEYSFVVHKVKEMAVYYPEFEEPGCGVFFVLTFTFPENGVAGECRKPGTCLGWSDFVNYPSSGCITGLVFGGPCTRSSSFISKCDAYEEDTCSCDGGFLSPIVIDVDHSGFSMSDSAEGVVFDFLNDGVPLALSWTGAHATNAFLVLDRNGNGNIDNGTELFGNVTPQPDSPEPNGFLALAEYDKLGNGGNGNGRIDTSDAIFSNLRLWQDKNHNGISEPTELKILASFGITGVSLDYKESKKTDSFGNAFRYRAKIYDSSGGHTGRWAWDVFLTVQ